MMKHPVRRNVVAFSAAVAAAAVFIACGDPTSPFKTLSVPTDASFARSDATNGGGVGFHWISPVAPSLPSYPGTFDPARSSSIVVQVCKWVSGACDGPLVASFTGAQLTVTTSTQSYRADWPISGLPAGTFYRIRVLENGYELGFADAKKPVSGESIAALNAAQIIPLANTSVYQIRFRLAVRVATQMAYNAGDAQTATAGSPVATAPSVIVKDANNQPLAGVSVTFAPASGGGSVTGGSATTDANGIATVGSWTLGTTAGSNTLTAASTGLTGSPVTFTATGAAGAATQIAVNAGNGQSATAGSAVATAPSAIVKDAYNNPVAGVNVTFAVTAGGGSVGGSSTISTDANGVATVDSWTLGTVAGTNNNTLLASASGVGTPASFTASATAGAATQITLNAGDAQTATAGSPVATAPSVLVRDANNNPVAGTPVTFAVASGGGSVGGPATVNTNASGIATVGSWTLGTTAGSNSLTATSGSLSGSPVTFTATGSAGAATSIAANGGDGQSATAGSAVATAPSVIVKDANNNPVAGIGVTFAVGSGGGSSSGNSATTNSLGIATVGSWTLGTTAGTSNNTLTATSGSLSGSPVTFTASATPGAAASVAVNAGDGQSATAGTAVSIAPSVVVRDQYSNPVGAGTWVTFAVTSGGGSVGGSSTVSTNSSGIATIASWTLGTSAGTNTLSASVTGVLTPASFTASATVGAAASIAVNGGDNQSATAGSAVSTAPSVIVRDANNNPVPGVSVTFAVASGGGSSTGNSATTNAGGIATVGSWTLGPNAGTNNNTLTATSGSLSGSPVTFTASATAGAAATIGINGGNNQSATVGTAVATAPSVIVRDANNNPVSGISVTFAVGLGGGSSTGNSATTNASGIATVGSWTLGTSAGTSNNTLTATSGSLFGSPVTFIASATAGAAASIAVNGGNNQSAIAGGNVSVAPSVIVRDANNNPVSGVSVTFAVASGGGSSTGSPATTNASGIATVGSWTLGPTAGTNNNTLTATSGSLSGSPVTFTASGTVGPAASIALNGGNNQSATVGSAVSTAPSVIVRDVNNNPVSGVSVTFAVTGGGGSVTGSPATTNASGVATVGSWTLGTSAGTNNNTMNATSGSLSGSPVTFTASATGGAPANMTIQAGDAQTANSGSGVSTLPRVRVTDANGNALSGVSVTFSVAGGGGSGTGFSTTTNSSGDATVGSWTLGSGGAGCTSLANIASCTRNRLNAVATGGSAPSASFVANIPPIVPAPTYQAVGNVLLTIADGSTDILSQSYSINGANGTNAGVTATANTLTGSASGSVVLAANGSFTYTSANSIPAGTNETFSFVVSDGIASTNTTATLTVNVPSRVLYVQPGYAGTSSGTSAQPFKDFSSTAGQGVQAVAAAGDVILVTTGTGAAVGGTLKNTQTVYGQGASANYTFTTGSASTYRNGGTTYTLLTGNGTAPQIGGLTLGSGNTLRGFTMASGTLTGSSFGTLTVSEASINTNAAAISLTTGTLSGSFSSVTSTATATNASNISMTGVTTSGTFGFGSGALSGATGSGHGFYINGSSPTLTYSGSITNTTSSGNAVDISGVTGGSITLSGNINSNASKGRGISITSNTGGTFTFSGGQIGISTGAGTGVNLATNTGATIAFTPSTAMQIITSSATAFSASGGGTVTVTGSANTITTTGTGAGLSVSATSIGSSGLTFRSITTAGGGTNGIFLNNTGTGASNGGLTVAGNGDAGCGTSGSTCDGGTIGGTSGSDGSTSGFGIYLNATKNPSFTNMRVNGTHTNFGLYGTSISGLTLNKVRMDGTYGTTTSEGAVGLVEMSGSGSVTNSYFLGSTGNNFYVNNTLAATTLNALVLTGVNIGNTNSAAASGQGLYVLADRGTTNVTVTGSTFNGGYNRSAYFHIRGGSSTITFTGNTLSNTQSNSSGTNGLTPQFANVGLLADSASNANGAPGTISYNISNNTINNGVYHAVTIRKYRGQWTITGSASNNIIGTAAVTSSASLVAPALHLDFRGQGSHQTLIDGNTIRNANWAGIQLSYNSTADAGASENGLVSATIRRNLITNPAVSANGPGYTDGINLNWGVSTDSYTTCIDLGAGSGNGNNIVNAGDASNGLPLSVGGFASTVNGTAKILGLSGGPYTGSAAYTPVANLWAAANGISAGNIYMDYGSGSAMKTTSTANGLGSNCNLVP